MNHIVGLAVLCFLYLASPAGAQPRCKKGIACGNSCIAATKTCRIGTTPERSDTTKPLRTDSDEYQALLRRVSGATAEAPAPLAYGPFVGSVDGSTVYLTECRTADKLTGDERVYFRTEEEAASKGYRRSRARGC